MRGLLLAVQQVEIVEGGSWLSQNLGSVLLAVAAIVAASLAALVAILNQRRQLDHDRFLRNRDYQKDVVDATFEGVNDSIDKLSNLGAQVAARDSQRMEWAEEEAETGRRSEPQQRWKRKTEADMAAAYASVITMGFDHSRLALRFEEAHPIVEAHQHVEQELKKWLDALVDAVSKGSTTTLPEVMDSLKGGSGKALAAFRGACQDWFNA